MNTGDSLVSLIVPVYNVGNYLNVCVDSLLRQTYANIQVILVDDGSTDGSADLCDAWADKDSRVMVIHQANNGVSMARNAGINAAEGDWLEFVDSDDWLEEGTVDGLLGLVRDKHAQMAIFNYRSVSAEDTLDTVREQPADYRIKEGILSRRDVLDCILAYSGVKGYVWNKFFSRTLIEQGDLQFDSNISMCEDLLFNVECASLSTVTVSTNQCLYNYRSDPNSTSHKVDLKSLATCLEAHERMMSIVPQESKSSVKASYAILAEELLLRTYDVNDITHCDEYRAILRRYWWHALKRQHSPRYWVRILGGALCPSLFYPVWNCMKGGLNDWRSY